MKKILLLAILLFTWTILAVPCFAQPDQSMRVIVNNKLVDFPDAKPFINKDSRTMVPVRFIGNELGAAVNWDGPTQTVTIQQGGKTIVLVIGNTFAHVDGQRIVFDTAAEIVDNRTMVPLRFISETFGAKVEWNDILRTVYINTTPADPPPPPAVTLLTLYFSDDQAQYLVAETREVILSKPNMAELIFDELLAGPRRPDLRSYIPAGTRHMGLNVYGGIAYLNLNSHFRNAHTGGSAGERMTLYSIVNSLAELADVGKVQFLLEGQYQDAILGHIDTSQPLTPRPDLVK